MSSPFNVSFHESAKAVRKHILRCSKQANVGHIGSCLSIVELLLAVYEVANLPSPQDPNRDRVILSKGHAALALYGVLVERGVLSPASLDSFFKNGDYFGVHPEHGVEGVDFSTGSLGQGLGFAVGAAMAAKRQGSQRRVFVILSDAEMNEGSVWEAVMFAAHHGLDNLHALVDVNGQQAFGYTKDVINLHPLEEKWQAFGWQTHVAPGHDVPALAQLLNTPASQPTVLLAQTTFGKGVSYMERQIPWHYMPMNEEQFTQAMNEVDQA